MKSISSSFGLLFLTVAWLVVMVLLSPSTTHARDPDLEVFERSGCGRCEAAHEYLEDLRARRPDLLIVERDVTTDQRALQDITEAARSEGVPLAFPAFRVRGELVVGFESSATTGQRIERLLERSNLDGAQPAQPDTQRETVELPLLGTVDVHRWGLPVFTIAIGLIDGFNPCAMWVLLFLLAMLVSLEDRSRIALIAGTFVLVSGLAYYAFMAAWLSVFMLVGVSRVVQIMLGSVAIAVAVIHVKDFVAPKRGPSLSIPETAKPRIYARVRAVLEKRKLSLALGSAAVLAVMVNVVELLCTAGLPAVYTQVLAQHHLSPWGRLAYLGLYDLAYMLDDCIMVAIAVVTLGRHKLQERGGRILKLVSGLTLGVLGVLLVAAPELVTF